MSQIPGNDPSPTLNYHSPTGDSWEEVLKIAKAQKLLLWVILGNIIANVSLLILSSAAKSAPATVQLLFGIGLVGFILVIVALQIAALVNLMRAMKMGIVSIIILAIGSVLSCIGLLVLLIINQRATTRLQRAGLKVGLMGAKIPDGPPTN